MYAWSRRVVRTLEGVHCVILALSTFLAGLYFGHSIPVGVDLLALQIGLVGIIAFLSLTHISAMRHLRRAEGSEADQVEQRLTRHTRQEDMIRIHHDRTGLAGCHISAKSATSVVLPIRADDD